MVSGFENDKKAEQKRQLFRKMKSRFELNHRISGSHTANSRVVPFLAFTKFVIPHTDTYTLGALRRMTRRRKINKLIVSLFDFTSQASPKFFPQSDESLRGACLGLPRYSSFVFLSLPALSVERGEPRETIDERGERGEISSVSVHV